MRKKFARSTLAGLVAFCAIGLVTNVAQSAPVQSSVESVPAAIAQQAPNGSVGKQAEPAVKPGSVNAKAEQAKGATQTVKVDAKGQPAVAARVAADTSVNFCTFYNYAWREFVYTSVCNTSSVTKYYHVQLWVPAQNSYRDFYSSAAPGSPSYPYAYGVTGTYYAYLYVWNGSSYAYDEYATSANNTSVVMSVSSSVYSGYVLATFTNYGNNYVTINSQELAPFRSYGTYTGGPHYDYPAAGGGSVSRYYYVGVGYNYGVVADVNGSSLYDSFRFAGVY